MLGKNSLQQPRAASTLAMVAVMMMCSHEMAARVVLEYLTFDYALSLSKQKLMVVMVAIIMGLGTICIAYMADKYFGAMRCLRAQLLVSLLAFLSLAVTTSNAPPMLHFGGNAYEVQMTRAARTTLSHVIINGKDNGFSINDDGSLTINSQDKNTPPQQIKPGQWKMQIGHGTTSQFMSLIPIALLILAGCFGMPMIFSAMGGLYGQRFGARTLGFVMIYAFLYLGFAVMELMEIYALPIMGRKTILGIAAFLTLAAYLRANFDKKLWRSQYNNSPFASGVSRNNALVYIAMGYFIIALLLMGTLFAIRPSQGSVKLAATEYAHITSMIAYSAYALWLAAILFIFVQIARYKNKFHFYAACAVLMLALIHVMTWSIDEAGYSFIRQIATGLADKSLYPDWRFYLDNARSLNFVIAFVVGGLAVLLLPAVHKRYPGITKLYSPGIALILLGLLYALLSYGAYHPTAQGLMAWPFFAPASIFTLIAQICISPFIISATTHVWRKSMPTVAAALLLFASGLSTVAAPLFSRAMGIKHIEPSAFSDPIKLQTAFGDAFLSIAGAALACGLLIVIILYPLYQRLVRAREKAAVSDMCTQR